MLMPRIKDIYTTRSDHKSTQASNPPTTLFKEKWRCIDLSSWRYSFHQNVSDEVELYFLANLGLISILVLISTAD